MAAKKTVALFDDLDKPYNNTVFAACPWLLISPEHGPWSDEAWITGSFSDLYGYEKPVIDALINTAPTKKETTP